jgi:hypothetical protein
MSVSDKTVYPVFISARKPRMVSSLNLPPFACLYRGDQLCGVCVRLTGRSIGSYRAGTSHERQEKEERRKEKSVKEGETKFSWC